MYMNLKKVTIIIGHYGSGKTNISVNLAMKLAKSGKSCTVVDLDIVNPYFRTADFKELFSENDIKLTVSKYANSNLDIPSLSFDIKGVISDKNRSVIIDLGGDDAGALALGRYREDLSGLYETRDIDMLYVVNRFRYLTKTPAEALELMRDIETASGLNCTGIINNSNLGAETTPEIILSSADYAEKVALEASLPIVAVTGKAEFSEDLASIENYFPVDIYVKNLF